MNAIETGSAAADGAGAAGAKAALRARGSRALLAAAALAAAGALLTWRQPLAEFGARFLDAWLDAQQAMLAASGNLNADGRAEFAVLLREGATPGAFREAVDALPGVLYAREADLAGWVVIETDAGDRAALDAVRALDDTRLVVPNRGLWICH